MADLGQVGIVFLLLYDIFLNSKKDCGWMRTYEKIFQSESAHTWQFFSPALWLFRVALLYSGNAIAVWKR